MIRAIAFGIAFLSPAMAAGQQGDVTSAPGAVLRGLDRVAGSTSDLDLSLDESVTFGRLTITVSECRYPADNPAGNAFAWIRIREGSDAEVIFEGWMIADSPALNALDHPRYDIWVLRCKTS